MSRYVPNLRRKRSKAAPKPKFYIYCEGARTEPDYFEALGRLSNYSLFDIIPIAAAGVPRTIADRSVGKVRELSSRRKDSYEKRDEVWAVFDRDEHPGFDEAIVQCEAAGVGVARSNPCFEVWLILHFETYDRPDHRHDTQSRFSEICSDYDPDSHKTTDCSKLVDRLEVAEKRAEAQLLARENEGRRFGAPSTTVFRLTRKLRGVPNAPHPNPARHAHRP